MKLLNLSYNDLEECTVNMNSFSLIGGSGRVMDVRNNKFGTIEESAQKKGDIFLLKRKVLFNQDVALSYEEGQDAIMLFFVRKGNSISINKETGRRKYFPSNTHGLYFMHADKLPEKDFFQGNKPGESSVFLLPLPYFRGLVDAYPMLFEQAYRRYQSGETFFLKDYMEKTSNEMYKILYQIENSDLMGNYRNAYVDAKILELLCLCLGSSDLKEHKHLNTFPHYEQIYEAAYILVSDIQNAPSVKELCRKVGLNPNTLHLGFKKIYNTTVYGYLFNYKMQLAEQLLKETNKPIVEVAELCGYDYSSHFCTAFKRKFGVSPSEKRRGVCSLL